MVIEVAGWSSATATWRRPGSPDASVDLASIGVALLGIAMLQFARVE
jgi:hypothetical protein